MKTMYCFVKDYLKTMYCLMSDDLTTMFCLLKLPEDYVLLEE